MARRVREALLQAVYLHRVQRDTQVVVVQVLSIPQAAAAGRRAPAAMVPMAARRSEAIKAVPAAGELAVALQEVQTAAVSTMVLQAAMVFRVLALVWEELLEALRAIG